MFKKANQWWKEKGLKHIGLVIAALTLVLLTWFGLLPGNFAIYIGVLLLGIAIGLNWQPLKDLSEFDELLERKFLEYRFKIKEEVEETKEELRRKYEELERKLKDYVNEQVKPFKDNK